MSELKVKHVVDVYDAYSANPYNEAQVYLQSEADKVIAEKDKEIAKLKKEKEYVIEHTAEVINGQERELRHRKRKWCLAMAKWCKRKCIDAANYIIPREMWDFYDKWHKRWLSIAEKFKEAK